MNALVGIGANFGGLSSASPEKRAAMRTEITSLARAALLGKAKALAAARGQTPAEAAKAAATNTTATKAAKTDSTSDSSAVSDAVNKELDKDTFLQLLVNQMQNQDPLDPTDNSQMIAQLAQFSSLEQMSNLNGNVETMSGNIDQLNFMTANSLLGHKVIGLDSEGNATQGTVSRVQMNGSLVYLTVGDKLVSMSNVLSIDPVPAATTDSTS